MQWLEQRCRPRSVLKRAHSRSTTARERSATSASRLSEAGVPGAPALVRSDGGGAGKRPTRAPGAPTGRPQPAETSLGHGGGQPRRRRGVGARGGPATCGRGHALRRFPARCAGSSERHGAIVDHRLDLQRPRGAPPRPPERGGRHTESHALGPAARLAPRFRGATGRARACQEAVRGRPRLPSAWQARVPDLRPKSAAFGAADRVGGRGSTRVAGKQKAFTWRCRGGREARGSGRARRDHFPPTGSARPASASAPRRAAVPSEAAN